MSETEQTVDPGTTAEQEQAVADMTATDKPKPAKVVVPPHPCYCSTFEVVDKTDPDATFTTGCESTTKSMFAQGHDARLVSFLVDSHFDGYRIRQALENNAVVDYATPEDAARTASEALGNKAKYATENKRAKVAAKNQRDADKARARAEKAEAKATADEAKARAKEAAKNQPKATGAEVVAGTREGDQTPLADGQARIKVGRFEYVAAIDPETGDTSYTTGAGEAKVVNRDGYRLLEGATA